MEKTNVQKKRKTKEIALVSLIVLALVVGGAGMFLIFINNGTETHTSSEVTTTVEYFHCQAGEVEDAFFSSEAADEVENDLKLVFAGDELQKVSYTYTGTFPTEQVAKEEIDSMQTKLYKYAGDNGIDIGEFASGFTIDGVKGIANIFMERKILNSNTAKIIFLNEVGLTKIGRKNAMEELRILYENKGFTCNNG